MSDGKWNLADVWEAVADAVPDRPAQRQGGRTITWAEFDRRANALGRDLLTAGLGHQSKLAAYLYNCPEYLESYTAALKVGVAPLNVNYRYGPDEVAYLLDNADAEAVVFQATFASVVAEIADRLPLVKRYYVVDDGAPRPDWATPYESVVGDGADRVLAPWGRSGEDLVLLYTGGTTGMPKGVMWEQHQLFQVLEGGGNPVEGTPPAQGIEEMRRRIAEFAETPPYVFLPASR